jgi:peptide/nickel transport system substrate-binding protein
MRRRDMLKAVPALAVPALARAEARPLRYIPNSGLSTIDPVWTTALVAGIHGYMVFDTLYGIDAAGQPHPQMCAGHEVSADGLTWTFTLRGGLTFHDGEKVLAKDCVMSVRRWGSRDSFGQPLMAATNEIDVLDDRRSHIRLRKPFSQMLYGLGARGCFIMPERIAKTPGTEQIKETVGSGPFRFLPDQWVSGVSAAYARFDGYVPRQEPASFLAGGKAVHVQRVEWVVQPDAATAAAALQKGEVDWLEVPLIDLCPMLHASPGVRVVVNDPFGWPLVLALNHVQPPFNNPKLRRALLPAIDQTQFLASVVGDQTELARAPAGYFVESQPMASQAGLEVLSGPRDEDLAKRLIRESGYAGEKLVMLAATDRPVYSQMMQVARDLFVRLGLNVDFQPMDWGSVVSRRTSREPVSQGGWSCFITQIEGVAASTPGGSFELRGNGAKAWFGWPEDAELERLRTAWFDAPDLPAQKVIAAQVQMRALETLPCIPLGQLFQPTAFRSDLVDIVKAAYPLFWSVRRG